MEQDEREESASWGDCGDVEKLRKPAGWFERCQKGGGHWEKGRQRWSGGKEMSDAKVGRGAKEWEKNGESSDKQETTCSTVTCESGSEEDRWKDTAKDEDWLFSCTILRMNINRHSLHMWTSKQLCQNRSYWTVGLYLYVDVQYFNRPPKNPSTYHLRVKLGVQRKEMKAICPSITLHFM